MLRHECLVNKIWRLLRINTRTRSVSILILYSLKILLTKHECRNIRFSENFIQNPPHASINKTTEVLNYIEERQKTSNFINFSKNKDILQESHRNLVFGGIS